MPALGLVGYPLSHSFSPEFFRRFWLEEGIAGWSYELYPLAQLSTFPTLKSQVPDLRGLNVTIPHKEAILPYLTGYSEEVIHIGAANTLVWRDDLKGWWGHNTDWQGFRQSLSAFLPQPFPSYLKALILGTGGSAKAVAYALDSLQIPYLRVSRQAEKGDLSYGDLTLDQVVSHKLIINTTPLGMYPHTEALPPFPYNWLSSEHYLYDLVYNPPITAFMQAGLARGCEVKNGYDMLAGQALAAWDIWTA